MFLPTQFSHYSQPAVGHCQVGNDSLSVLQVNLEGLQEFAAEKLAPYQIPKLLEVLDEMPRNAMGKINKKALVKGVFPQQQ